MIRGLLLHLLLLLFTGGDSLQLRLQDSKEKIFYERMVPGNHGFHEIICPIPGGRQANGSIPSRELETGKITVQLAGKLQKRIRITSFNGYTGWKVNY